jgi:predicted nucleic acid-binding protein
MILVDTSVWIAFFQGEAGAASLGRSLENDAVLGHPWVTGELMLGSLGRRRDEIIADLDRLPTAPLLDDREIRALIDARKLAGTGIGWVDAQLVGSALIAGALLWTLDRRLAKVASRFGLGHLANSIKGSVIAEKDIVSPIPKKWDADR